MRDLINLLTESRGLGARRSGEIFADPEGNQIRFVSINFYPDGGGNYETEEETQLAINAVLDQLDADPTPTNWFRKGQTRAFGVAQFIGDDGPMTFIKYFKSVQSDPTQNDWDNQTGIPGYRYASKAAVKTQSHATPQDILTELEDLTPMDIVEQISAKFPNSILVAVAQHLAIGGELPYTFPAPTEMDLATFQDYFCELLQPIALQSGQYEGEAKMAEEAFLGGVGYAGTLISFGNTKTEGLSDSILVAEDGRTMKVSTKGGKGAAASTKNILDAYNQLVKTKEGKKILKQVDDAISIINTVSEAGQAEAPLLLGVEYGIIDEKDADFIRTMKAYPILDLNDFITSKDVSKTLIKLATERGTKTPESTNLFFHLTAAVAHKVADYVNESTNFKHDAALILNHSALVQVYSKVTFQGKQWTLHKFTSKWPGSAISEIEFDAGKNYYSTGIKGNFTFVVDPTKKSKGKDAQGIPAAKPKAAGASMSADKTSHLRKDRPPSEKQKSVGREKR